MEIFSKGSGLKSTFDNHQRRIFRLAFGVAASSAVAIGFAWPLSYLAPMLITSILGAADESPGLKKSLALLLIIFVGLFAGVIFSALFIGQPVLASLLLALIFYWIYYFVNRGILPNFAGIMLIIGMTVIPLMSQIDTSLASYFSEGFLIAATTAVLFSYGSYLLFPHSPEVASAVVKVAGNSSGHSLGHSRRIAGISTLVVMPAMILFLTFNWVGSALIIAFIAILSLNPALEQGKKAGIGLLLGNALGGLVAIVFYNVMKTAPHYVFYVLLMSLFALFMAQRIHSGKKSAVFWGMALSTLLVLTGPIFTGEGDDAGDKFSARLLQIGAAALYIIMAFRLTAQMWPKAVDDVSDDARISN